MKISNISSSLILLLICSSCAVKNYELPAKKEFERTNDEVRNVWFSSYFDSSNNKHKPSNVEVVIRRSDWNK